MADNKQYITHTKDGGAIQISEDVIATIVLQSLNEIEGYAGTTVIKRKSSSFTSIDCRRDRWKHWCPR